MTVLLLTVVIGGIYLWSKEDKKNTIIKEVESFYLNETGFIMTYPFDRKTPYLSESIGLWMEWLVQESDEKRFEEMVILLNDYFIVRIEGEVFIKWQVGKEISVNAWIDDSRIVSALLEGGKLFQREDYLLLAQDIRKSAKHVQLENNWISEFYDWELKASSDSMVTSYLDHILLDGMGVEMRPIVQNEKIFFPEKVKRDGTPVSSPEAHLVDQLLIATYSNDVGIDVKAFERWLIDEYQKNGKLYGRYFKATGEPSVNYESRAVYALAIRFLKDQHPDVASLIADEHYKMLHESPNENMHFFDYMVGVLWRE